MMKRKFTRFLPVFCTFFALFGVVSCASPARNLIDAQIHDLSDDQLCVYHNNYRSEPRVEAEIAARGVNCDRFYRKCLSQGNQPGTQAMQFCIDTLRENERLRYEQDRWDDFGIWGYRDYDRLRSARRR
ncbi:MAG: hypothetical protein DI551_06665 [Micavibrio aeruginosavorus]|uniref:Lipoprotein n=1 Tax=Micavibrio aeruginosavorus TaxID=349221 RepID=A0A2W5MWW6_9BACT|nr:MAG: hypothetical protein DI551_06665 [Micavibrio aeruginosavorus]